MPPSPVPADPGWDEDLAWLDRDPMTAAESRLAGPGCASTTSLPAKRRSEEDFEPFTAEELAEIDEAAADELLAVKAASTGGGALGSLAPRGSSPVSRAARRPGSARGCRWTCCRAAPGLAVAADAAAGEDGRFGGVSEAELVGVMCAWDRVEAHAHARKLAAVAELARRNPGELDAEFTADQVAYALGESRARADSLIGMAQTLPARLPGTKAGLEDGTISRYKAEIIARATALLEDDEARAAEAEVLDRAARLTPGRAARRDRPRGDQGRPGEGEGAAGDRGEGCAGGAVAAGHRERGADGLRAAPGRGAGRR